MLSLSIVPIFSMLVMTVTFCALFHSHPQGLFRWKNFTANHLPLLIGSWCVGTIAAAAMSPGLDTAEFILKNWLLCIFMWCNDGTLLLLVFFFTGTSSENILHRRYSSIKRAAGDKMIYGE